MIMVMMLYCNLVRLSPLSLWARGKGQRGRVGG